MIHLQDQHGSDGELSVALTFMAIHFASSPSALPLLTVQGKCEYLFVRTLCVPCAYFLKLVIFVSVFLRMALFVRTM